MNTKALVVIYLLTKLLLLAMLFIRLEGKRLLRKSVRVSNVRA